MCAITISKLSNFPSQELYKNLTFVWWILNCYFLREFNPKLKFYCSATSLKLGHVSTFVFWKELLDLKYNVCRSKLQKWKKTNLLIMIIIIFPVWLQSRLISAEFEPVLSHTAKSSIASYYIHFRRIFKRKSSNQ